MSPLLCLVLALSAQETASVAQVSGTPPDSPDELVSWENCSIQKRWVPLLEKAQRGQGPGARVLDEKRFLEELDRVLPLPEGSRIELTDPFLPSWTGVPTASVLIAHGRVNGTFAYLRIPMDLSQVSVDGLAFHAHPVPGGWGTPLPLSLLAACLEVQLGALSALDLEGLQVEACWLRHDFQTHRMELEVSLEEVSVDEPASTGRQRPTSTKLVTGWHITDLATPAATAEEAGARLVLQQGERRQLARLIEPLHGRILHLLGKEQGRLPMHYEIADRWLYFELEGSTAEDLTFTLGDVELGFADFVALTELVQRARVDGAWLADVSVFPVDAEDPLPWQKMLVITAAGPGKPEDVAVIEWPRGTSVDQGRRHEGVEGEIEPSHAILHDPWNFRFGKEQYLRASIDSGKSVYCSHGLPGPVTPVLDQEEGRSLIPRF